MRRYEEYKATGVEWMPKIPEHWEAIKLKWVCSFVYGESLSSDVRIEGGVPVFGSNGVTGVHNASITGAPCIIVGRKGSFGRINYCIEPCFPIDTTYYVDQRVTKHHVRWLYYALGILGLDRISKDTGVPGLSREDAYDHIVSVPPLREQRTIARFLDDKTTQIDQLITQKQKMLELLQEERAALINHAVTKGLDATAPLRDSGIEWLGEVPAHWEVKRLKWIAEIQGGLALSSGKILTNPVTLPYLRVANVQDGYLDLEEIKMVEVEEDQINRYSLQKGDLLMNEGGDNDKLGRGCVWRGEIEPCLHQNHVFAVRLFDGYSPEWLNLVTTTESARIHFLTRAKQSTNLASISSTNIKELPVVLPPVDEQYEILDFVTEESARIVELTSTINQEITLLQEYRAALIAEAVTGQVDVRNYEPASISTAELVG